MTSPSDDLIERLLGVFARVSQTKGVATDLGRAVAAALRTPPEETR